MALASAHLSITREETAVVQLDHETRAAIEEGLAQAERGEFVPDEIVAEADKRQGVRGFAIGRGRSLTANLSRRKKRRKRLECEACDRSRDPPSCFESSA